MGNPRSSYQRVVTQVKPAGWIPRHATISGFTGPGSFAARHVCIGTVAFDVKVPLDAYPGSVAGIKIARQEDPSETTPQIRATKARNDFRFAGGPSDTPKL
jgi:hypothetical protein